MGAEIRIRPYSADDAEALYVAARESVEQVSAWLPWCHAGYSLEEATDWVLARAELFERGVEYDFVITDADGQDTIAIRSMAYLALTYDHRLIDGADAIRFLRWVAETLEQPFLLSLQG